MYIWFSNMLYLVRSLIIYSLILASAAITRGQNIPRVGTPFVQQYSKSNYQAGNQNWSMTVDNKGIIYAANTEGLLAFDGQHWKLYPMQNNATLRSVNIDDTGRILVGGSGEFGFWTPGSYGKMIYTSLTPLVRDQQNLKNDEIWRIVIDGDKVYFHTFSKSYLYQDNKITTITADGEPFLFSFKIKDKLYFEQIPSGLHQLINGKLIRVRDADKLHGMNILCMIPFLNDDILIGTSKDGLFKLKPDGTIAPWETQADDFLKRYQLNNGVKLYGDQYAFGTIQNGIIILNQKGDIVQHINKSNGLQNNTVLSLSVDKQNNLWAGLDNGIDRIDINSPLYYYTDITGSLGTVYTSHILNDKIYLGTNQGLYVSDWHGPSQYNALNFTFVPNSEGQVWALENVGGKLICGHNNGTYMLENGKLILLSTITGAWAFQHIKGSSYWLQANYTGVGLMRTNPSVALVKQYGEHKTPIRHIIQKDNQEFWLSNHQNVFNFKLDTIRKTEADFANITAGLPAGTKLHGMYNLEENIVFASDSGFYIFDNILRSFKRYDELNDQLASFANANKIIPIKNHAYWFIKKSHIAKIQISDNGKLKIDSSSWNTLKGKLMNDYEHILNVNNALSLIALDNGFALYFEQSTTSKTLPPPIITNIWNTTTEVTPVYEDFDFPNKQNNIRIAYSSPWYSSTPVRYQYQLDGANQGWSVWEETSVKEFTNLSYGTYTFNVRAMDVDGTLSEVTAITFHIQAPWYLRWPMAIIYILIVIMLVYFANKHYERRLHIQQQKLKAKLLAEQEERLANEAAANEKKLISLKNIQLEQELINKNRELANSALNIVYKNEMLNTLHQELTNLNDSSGNKLSSDQLRKVNKLIEEAHNDDRDWDIFEKSFNEAHENFFKKLKAEYPGLVPNDLKLCAYLRLNMSSKEIASLLNISTRGVEIRRYRLRKKLDLPTSKNLTEFLLEF